MSEPHWILNEAKVEGDGSAVAYALLFYKTAPEDEILECAESEGFDDWTYSAPDCGGKHLCGDREEPCCYGCPMTLWLSPGREMDELRMVLFVNACEELYKGWLK